MKISLFTENLQIGYLQKILHQNLHLELYKSEFVCLIGKNGIGKSTLLRTLAGLQKPLCGKIFWENRNIQSISEKQKSLFTSLVLTERLENQLLSVYETVAMGRYPHTNWWGQLQKKDIEKIQKAIFLTNLDKIQSKNLHQISDGERQKTMIARALAQDTPLIFLDEATAHLDLANRLHIFKLLQDLAKDQSKSILFSTHELDLALQFADKIWLISEKEIRIGQPEDMILNGAFDDFFEGLNFNILEGSFEFMEQYKPKISVFGEKIKKIWTEKALRRIGFDVSDDSIFQIQIENNKWIFEERTFMSLAELVIFLEKDFKKLHQNIFT